MDSMHAVLPMFPVGWLFLRPLDKQYTAPAPADDAAHRRACAITLAATNYAGVELETLERGESDATYFIPAGSKHRRAFCPPLLNGAVAVTLV